MISPWFKRLNNAQYYELQAPTAHTNYNIEGDISSAVLPSRTPSYPSLGKPTVKKRFHISDISAAGLSLICAALAITVVANESVSWHLRPESRQLIVVGFLLGIMNLCLSSVTSNLFLLLEARFGPSTLHNYDGILRNHFLSSRLSLVWRIVLGLMTALPLALSAGYKNFLGGKSATQVDATTYIGNASYYGMFAPPGLQSLGQKTGISLFANATLPFAVATSLQNGSEPSLPTYPRAYGFNILSLNNESTAMLDIPQLSYVSAIQQLLALGESWTITAPVIATVATFNQSTRNESFIESMCAKAKSIPWVFDAIEMFNGFRAALLDYPSPGDQSLQYFGFMPSSGASCQEFVPYAIRYDISRQFCEGTWSITRGGIQLIDGFCNSTILPLEKQQVITNNMGSLGDYYMPSLAQFLGEFATTRNESQWKGPSMATGIAAMLWSRTTVLAESDILPRLQESADVVGLIYSVNDTVIYIRPTLQKSSLLYCILALQPLLIVVILGLRLMFHSTPLDTGFGLISILSGINRGSLDILGGAALSGELERSVKLVIHPIQDNQNGRMEYHVSLPSAAPMRNGRLNSKVMYH